MTESQKQVVGGLIVLSLIGWGFKQCGKDTEPSTPTTTQSFEDKPVNPEIKTDYGQLPDNYTTQDEYYIDGSGNKVWHGHRKTFYPGGRLRFDAYYEHGKNIWNKKYN